MFGFECDCSQDADWSYEEWEDEPRVHDGSTELKCVECRRVIKPGETYQHQSGIDPDWYQDPDDPPWRKYCKDDEDYLRWKVEFDARVAANESHRQDLPICLGCQRISERFTPHGRLIGMLAAQVERCIGYDYREDPAELTAEDLEDIEEEDRLNREAAQQGHRRARHEGRSGG